MAKAINGRDTRMRERIIHEAARVMAEEGVSDYSAAKRKAADRLGAPDTRNLPQNREVQAALADYQRLFGGEERSREVRRLLETAVEAMVFFGRFRPRLVGSLLDGTAGSHSTVTLHLFAQTPEDVVLFLIEHDIPFDTDERAYRYGSGDTELRPVHSFVADGVPLAVAVFGERGLREPPRSRVGGQPMTRASIDQVRAMLAE